jgi:hypothetical protein
MAYVIGISGRAGVGKSTLARWLADRAAEDGMTAIVVSFAAPLKAMLSVLGPFPEDKQAQVPNLADNISYRKLCQTLGDWGRKLDPDFWVDPMRMFVQTCEHDLIIIDDMRQPNELAMCQRFGTTVRIDGEGYALGALALHASEGQPMQTAHQIRGWKEGADEAWLRSARALAADLQLAYEDDWTDQEDARCRASE